MVRATLDSLRDLGAQPFVVAAMGSHGGATAEGQRELLAEYGVSEQALGVPVKTDMTAVQIGTNSWGEPVWWDKNALEADAVVTVSRVKPHTDFRGRFESGIVKMLVIGLGKRDGAAQHHRWGFRGLRDMLPETAKVILEKTPFVAGLAVLENAREQTARLQVVDRDELFDVEPGLLEEARGLMGRLPFEQLDLLVIGEIGKNYSGAGIDPNVVGRLLIEGAARVRVSRRITRICCLDLSPESHGNGTGVGIADLTTERLLAAIDPVPFRMNNLTACFLWRSQVAVRLPDRPRVHRDGHGDLLAAEPLCRCAWPSSPTRWRSPSCGCPRRWSRKLASIRTWKSWADRAAVAVRCRRQFGARETVSSFSAWTAQGDVTAWLAFVDSRRTMRWKRPTSFEFQVNRHKVRQSHEPAIVLGPLFRLARGHHDGLRPTAVTPRIDGTPGCSR